jgi:hypothetical protein
MALTNTPRQYTRSVWCSHVQELRRSGRLAEVRAAASERLVPLLDQPREAPKWMDGLAFDELNAVVYGLRGREGLRELLQQVMKSGLAKVLEPIIQLALAVFGGTPAAILSRADSLLAVNSRGVRMKWMTSTFTSGIVQVSCGEVIPPISWIAWEGIFIHVVELAGVSGAVGEARASADGLSCEIDVSWTPR